jgi:Photosynthesis system II assembly factor YCF48
MPSDDRERSFEHALASHLRADNSAPVSRAACADAETLAAYHERSLPQEQMTSLLAHVADCERCQEILTQLRATDEIPIAVATTPQATPDAPHEAKSPVRVLPARTRALWRWVAPAGALAAALLVWVAVHENNSVRVPPQLPSAAPKQSETAKNLPASSSALTYAPSLDATPKNENAFADALTASNTAPQSKIAGAARQRPQSLLKEKDSASDQKKSSVRDDFGQLARNPLSTNALPASDEGLKSQTGAARTDAATTEVAGAAAEAKAANVRGALTSQSPQVAPERGAVTAAKPPAPTAPSARTELSRPRAAAPLAGAVQQEQQLEATPRFKSNAEMRLANTVATVTISSPSRLTSWRAGPAGAIEFSSDAGKTWTVQPGGVIADLLAGSAPSDKVCWIVGRSGTILRTTDGGAHWQRLRPPTQYDLRSISAADAQRATVSSTNGAYQTTDGGATWKQVAPE